MPCDSPRRFDRAVTAAFCSIACLAASAGTQVDGGQRAIDLHSHLYSDLQQAAVIARSATFARPVIYGTGADYASAVAVGDLNGDGKPDLAVANSCQAETGGSNCGTGGVISVLVGNGDGTFQSPVTYNSGGTAASSIAIADVNGDGYLDLITANQCISAANCSDGAVSVLLGNGNGTFRPAVAYLAGYGANSVTVADLNHDGHPDLIIADGCLSASSCNNGGVSVLLGNGNGTFQGAVTYSSGGQNAVFVAARDLNEDGFADVVVINQCFSKSNCTNGGVAVLLGNGNGTLQVGLQLQLGRILGIVGRDRRCQWRRAT